MPSSQPNSPGELVSAPLFEAGLLLAIGAIGWAVGYPLLFASLGPTAYEQIEQSDRPTSHPYNIIVGHYVALGAGFLSVWAIDAWNAAHILGPGSVALPRLWATVLAALMTVFLTQLLKATQPAALSTMLLVTTGAFQGAHGAEAVLIAVALITIIGEPIRRFQLKRRQVSHAGRQHAPKVA